MSGSGSDTEREDIDFMKRRVLIFAAAAVAGMLLLTACTSKEDGAGQSAGAPSDAASGQTNNASSDAAQQSIQTEPAADGQADASVPSQGEVSGTPADDIRKGRRRKLFRRRSQTLHRKISGAGRMRVKTRA